MNLAYRDQKRLEILLEQIERHPESLGYLPKSSSAYPDAGAYRNPLGFRGRLEDSLLYHAGEGDATGLETLLYGNIDLVVFERYTDLMEPSRLNAGVEDIYDGRRKFSRVGRVFYRSLWQLVNEGNKALFDEKISLLVAMGGKRILSSPLHAASVRPEEFWNFHKIEGAEKTSLYRHGIKRLLDAGMANILSDLTKPLDPALFLNEDRREDMSSTKKERLHQWEHYLKALVLGYDPENQRAIDRLPVGACGAVYLVLQDLIVAKDAEGVHNLSKRFDLVAIYETLANHKPLGVTVGRKFSKNIKGFTPTALLNLSLPSPKGPLDADSFEMFDVLLSTGLSRYLDDPKHKFVFASELSSDYEKNPALFDAVYERAGLGMLVEGIKASDLVVRALKHEYVCASFYFKMLRESSDSDKLKANMLNNLPSEAQVRLFEGNLIMERFGLLDNDRKFCSADKVRSQLFSIDLGL